MEIDLYQLPIPNWGLRCPTCRYRLRGLAHHVCPECGTELDMGEIVQSWHRVREPWYTGDEFPVLDFGLTCSQCAGSLTGAAQHVCPTCGLDFDPLLLAPPWKWFQIDHHNSAGLPQHIVVDLLTDAHVPYVLSHERGIADVLGGMAAQRLRAASEFYFDFLFLITQEAKRLAQRRSAAQSHTWKCTHCGEENPGSFDVCWNCQKPSTES